MLLTYSIILNNTKNANPAEIDTLFNEVKNIVNGNIEDDNIKAGAAINPSKISGTALTASDPTVAADANSVPKRDGSGDLIIKRLIGTSGTNIELVGLGSDTIVLRPNNVSAANGMIVDEDAGNFISLATGQTNGFLFSDDLTLTSPLFLKTFSTGSRPSSGTIGRLFANTTDLALNFDLGGGGWDTVISAQASDIIPTGDTATNGHITVTIDGTAVKLATVA